jgi:Na+/H+ antiporter NhaD/arsenite permease-like protein
MATSDFERDPRPEEEQSPVGSELIGVKLTLLLGIGLLAVLAAFFLIGPVVGMLVLLAAVVAAILALVKVIRRAEEPPG